MEIYSYTPGSISRRSDVSSSRIKKRKLNYNNSYSRETQSNYSVGSMMFSPMGASTFDASAFTASRRAEKRTINVPNFWEAFNRLSAILLKIGAKILVWGVSIGLVIYASHYIYENCGRVAKGVSHLDQAPNELEILDKAMSEFTLSNRVEHNEFGDVLDENGNVITSGEMLIKEPVTYREYTIQSKDTISGIAYKFGLHNYGTLIAVNNVSNARVLPVGKKFLIPSMDGIIHEVKSDETANGIALRYGIPYEDLLDVNDLESDSLTVGQKLFIPGAKMDTNALRMAMGETFINPLNIKYRLTSYFGPRKDPFTGVQSNHTGIDMACATGTPIRAALGGTIAVSSYSNIYGNYVIINHGNGYQTLYAHMSKKIVRTGQYVNQGERIGLVGSTGYSTGPHLHFTVYKNGKLTDPLKIIGKK